MIRLFRASQMELSRRNRITVNEGVLQTWLRETNLDHVTPLIRSVVQSVFHRTNSFFNVCPGCWLPVGDPRTGRITECCCEIIHIQCYFRKRLCPICRVVPMLLRRFRGTGPSAGMIVDRVEHLRSIKFKDVFLCPLHERCLAILRYRRPVTLHVGFEQVPYPMTRAARDRFLDNIFQMEIDISLRCYSHPDSSTESD